MQADYSSEMGTMLSLTDSTNQAMAELAKGTVLGGDGASKLVGEMGLIGKSAEETRDYIQQTMNDAHKMGLNASKVLKNIQSNIKLLNKYNFKDGSKGLASMAQSATKLGLDMNLVTTMADKLFDIEGAVEMSAQLQVMGGEWAKLADPFKLMYMARNDMDALFKSVVNATKGIARLNKEGTEFEIPALEKQRLRKVAEQTGLSFEDLAASAKNAARFANISGQISIDVDPDTKEFISTTAKLNNGKASIEINGSEKLLDALNQQDISQLKAIAADKKSLRDRAKDSQNFDDALKNTISLFKTAMLPVVEGLNETLIPLVRDMFADKHFKQDLADLGKRIGNFVAGVSSVIKTVGEIAVALGPTGTLATMLIGGALFEAGKWYANGVALGTGFNTVASAGGGAPTGIGGFFKGGSKLMKYGGGALGGGLVGGIDAMNSDSVAEGAGNVIGGAIGGALGTLIPIPGIGTMIGGFLGSKLGGWIGKQVDGTNDGYFESPVHDGHFDGLGPDFSKGRGIIQGGKITPIDDGYFESPVHDGHFDGLGPDFSKGRGIIQGGKITPIDNKDDLIAAKPKGVIDNVMSNTTPKELTIKFGEIKFGGSIVLTNPGNNLNVDLSQDLLKNQEFIRNITKMIHIEATKAINGGKISGQPAY
jgi:hypothetical protein